MKKTLIIAGSVIAILLAIIVTANILAPKEIDWTPTYETDDRNPLGLYVFDNECDALFKGDSVTKFAMSPYEYLDGMYDYDADEYSKKGSFLRVSEYNNIDEESAKELLNYADHGNTVLLSMKDFPAVILDTLGLQINETQVADSIHISLAGKTDKYWFKEGHGQTYFDSLATGNDSIAILGYQQNAVISGMFKSKTGKKAIGPVKAQIKTLPNFVKAKFGYGYIILHTQPAAFTNYYLLNNNYKYAQAIASQIPRGVVLWQNGDYYSDDTAKDSIFDFFSVPAFRAFWYLGLCSLAVFIFFNARRRQRVVPIIASVENTTIDFAKTIGNLYYQEGNHHTIIEKKIIYFLEKVRTEYLIDTYDLNDAFVEKLHYKTGKPVADIETTINLIKKHRHQFQSTEADVVAINNAIEKLRL